AGPAQRSAGERDPSSGPARLGTGRGAARAAREVDVSGDKLARIDAGAALAPSSYAEARSMAADLAKAKGFVPDAFVGNPGAVLAALMTGAEIGIGPMQAMRSIHVVK